MGPEGGTGRQRSVEADATPDHLPGTSLGDGGISHQRPPQLGGADYLGSGQKLMCATSQLMDHLQNKVRRSVGWYCRRNAEGVTVSQLVVCPCTTIIDIDGIQPLWKQSRVQIWCMSCFNGY
jgi:hypothetical protein